MRLLTTICFISFLLPEISCLAQYGPIEFYKGDLGMVFTQNGQILKPKDLVALTEGHIQADMYMKKAKTNSDWSSVFGIIGGALVGWPIGTALGGGDPNWVLAGAGAGLIGIAIPLSIGYKKNAIRGTRIYNENIATSAQRRATYRLITSNSRVGISFSF